MRKGLIPVLVVLGLIGLLIWQLAGEGAAECRVCLSFNGHRRCVTTRGPDPVQAQTEALTNICAQLAKGVTESVACSKRPPDEVSCQRAQ